jgi:adenosylcobinamide kinase/adenosylcobinamide-phosphate guanylyltransferase
MSEESGRSIVLVLGGVRSGKSRYAQELAARGERVAFLATAEARDDDMRQRIERHRDDRPSAWTTVEEPLALEESLLACRGKFDTILIDCLTVWTANLMEREGQDCDRIFAHADRLAQVLCGMSCRVVMVSNEVGSGIVPDNEMARFYRDVLGGINQRIAAAADQVILLVAGCPLVIKQADEVRA